MRQYCVKKGSPISNLTRSLRERVCTATCSWTKKNNEADMAVNRNEFITPDEAVTLDGLFRERVKRTPEAVAYSGFNPRHANRRDYTLAQNDFQGPPRQTALERRWLKTW